jgi:hypothetical protein
VVYLGDKKLRVGARRNGANTSQRTKWHNKSRSLIGVFFFRFDNLRYAIKVASMDEVKK